MESGILYVVFNKWIKSPETGEMPYKIGITKKSVKERYYGLGLKMPGEFETVFAYQLEDCAKAEKSIQGILDKHRVNGEWFSIDEKILELIKSICETIMGGILVTDEFDDEIKIATESDIENDGEFEDYSEDNSETENDTINIKGTVVPLYKNKNEITQDFVKRILHLFFRKDFIPDAEIKNMLDKDYCIKTFGIRYPIIQDDKNKLVDDKGHNRYWSKEKIGDYYICSQWWKSSEEIYRKKLSRWIIKIGETNAAKTQPT